MDDKQILGELARVLRVLRQLEAESDPDGDVPVCIARIERVLRALESRLP